MGSFLRKSKDTVVNAERGTVRLCVVGTFEGAEGLCWTGVKCGDTDLLSKRG